MALTILRKESKLRNQVSQVMLLKECEFFKVPNNKRFKYTITGLIVYLLPRCAPQSTLSQCQRDSLTELMFIKTNYYSNFNLNFNLETNVGN